MSRTYFIADLHLGDTRLTKEQQEWRVDRVLHCVTKRDSLWILGDAVVHKRGLPLFEEIAKHIQVNLILGNHDLPIKHYAHLCNKICGFVKYKGFWLSHCPIHPKHLRGEKGNIHGHLHGTIVGTPEYYNVNYEVLHFDGYHGKVDFKDIQNHFEEISQ